jgi:hypothetical protein
LETYQKTVAPSEIRWGILKTPKPMRNAFPKFNALIRRNEISIEANGETTLHMYDNDDGRIRGMRSLFVRHHVFPGHLVEIEVVEPFKKYKMSFGMSQEMVYELLRELGGKATAEQVIRLILKKHPEYSLHFTVEERLDNLAHWGYVKKHAGGVWEIISERSLPIQAP